MSLFCHARICMTIMMIMIVSASSHAGNINIDAPINVIVVGGSSGMGKAAAVAVVRRGGHALIVSRSADKLKRASDEIKTTALACSSSNAGTEGSVSTAVLDITDESAVQEFASQLLKKKVQHDRKWNGLVISAAGRAPHGPIATLETSKSRELMDTKFWGAHNCVKYLTDCLDTSSSPEEEEHDSYNHVMLSPGIVFVSGVLNRRPGMNCWPLAATNGALEGLTRALALELGSTTANKGRTIRVNCLSPGFCETERFDHMDPSKKEAMLQNTADSLPLKRVGQPSDMGEAIYYLLTAPFTTGAVLDVDGGHGIRQYANPTTDPMRNNQQTS
jgi:NAD(P)-dependent dehydrogenase (short-subunit alcohol dehydrogenase family)